LIPTDSITSQEVPEKPLAITGLTPYASFLKDLKAFLYH
jgi:hypothetical protein